MEVDGFEVVRGVLGADEARSVGRAAVREMRRRPHMAHSSVMWTLRTHPAVLREFVRLWDGETDLVTGFDGVGRSRGDFVLPWHVDQTRRGRLGVQGILALSPHTASTGGLQLLRGSHRAHDDAVVPNAQEGEHEYHELGEAALRRVTDGAEVVTPRLAPGDMCVWDSRTVHRVVAGDGTATRLTAYLSFEPRSHLPVYVGVLRRRAVARGVATTHWASRCVRRGEDADGSDDSPPSVVTDAMRALV